ncbi:hypothetical protein KJ909_03070 [Patescibacteria group bacterium]|nr:hypothetical protein [Patescibacteria group bacterium]
MRVFEVVFKVLACVGFLYLTWRRLKDDYAGKKLVAFSWLALLVFFLSSRLIFVFLNWRVIDNLWVDYWAFFSKPGMIYSAGYIGVLLAVFYFSWKNDWKVWSFLEDLSFSFLFFTFFWFLAGGKWVLGGLTVLVFGLSFWLWNRYRSFVWYKSGKKGFVFWAANFIFWMLNLFISILFEDKGVNLFLAMFLSLISLIGLFILGEVWKKK